MTTKLVFGTVSVDADANVWYDNNLLILCFGAGSFDADTNGLHRVLYSFESIKTN